MKICEKCGKKIILSEWIRFTNEKGKTVFYCGKCYKKLPKEEKKKLTNCKAQEKMTLTGGEVLFGGLATGSNAGYKHSMKKQREKYGFTDKDVDAMSIDLFNKHFALCLKIKEHEKITKELIASKPNGGEFVNRWGKTIPLGKDK